jgi:predicted DNA binding protein
MAETLKNIDMSDITEKQRETLEVAIREGYYTRPRGISLSELAEHFDISEQALAQRLARAEETVMSQLFA